VRLRALAINIALALVYASVYWWSYVVFLNRQMELVGFDLFQRDPGFLTLAMLIVVAPLVCFRGVRAASSIIAVLVYLALYVPIILTLALGSRLSLDDIVGLQLVFMTGMCVLFLADVIIIKSPVDLVAQFDPAPIVFVLAAICTGYIVATYRGSLGFSSFGDDLYVQRAANDPLGAALVVRYVSSWLATVLVPLCIAYGLTMKRPWFIAMAVGASIILYAAAANKIALLLPAASVGFYLLTRRRPGAVFAILCAALSMMMATLLVIAQRSDGPLFLAASILLYRTIGNGGQITLTYYDFFRAHPHTDYSHVTGINWLTHPYPYGDLAIGQVIGDFYWSPFMNANAHFWATDGIAAMGAPGVVVASIVCALFFVVINAVTRGHEPVFVMICFLPFVMVLLNSSLFSAIWSGGGAFLLLFFVVARRPALRPGARVVIGPRTVAA
jgi:hypothetical protein